MTPEEKALFVFEHRDVVLKSALQLSVSRYGRKKSKEKTIALASKIRNFMDTLDCESAALLSLAMQMETDGMLMQLIE